MIAEPNFSAYFNRIGYAGPREPSLAVLRELCACHPRHIPFECLDPFLGIGVDLDFSAIQTKLIHSRRGGYCYELNGLFHDVLAALGFSITAVAARVVYGFKGQTRPLTHRLTLVRLAEGSFIADVGFGGQTPTAPLRLEPGLEQATQHGAYRVSREGDVFELQLKFNDSWEALYRFTLEQQAPIDFEVGNWFTSTHPRSLFTQNLIACRVVRARRVNLFNVDLSVREADGRGEHRILANARELAELLEDTMGIALPAPTEMIWKKAVNSYRSTDVQS